MPIILDETTRAEYLAQTVASTRASLVVSALTEPVVVEVFNGSNSLRATGTMASPWATVSGATITIGDVNAAGITVSAGGGPTSLWYCQFRGANGRFVRGTFGLPGQGRDFTWSLGSFEAGSKGTIGTAVLTALGEASGTLSPLSVAVHNLDTSTAAAGAEHVLTHVFKRGDVPAGASITLETSTGTPIPVQMGGEAYWDGGPNADGSLRFARLSCVLPSSISAGSSLSLVIRSSGSAPNRTAPRTIAETVALIQAADDYQVRHVFPSGGDVGTWIASRNHALGGTQFSASTGYGTNPNRGWRVIEHGPVCTVIEWFSKMYRSPTTTDYHYQLRGAGFVYYWHASGRMWDSAKTGQPNLNGPQGAAGSATWENKLQFDCSVWRGATKLREQLNDGTHLQVVSNSPRMGRAAGYWWLDGDCEWDKTAGARLLFNQWDRAYAQTTRVLPKFDWAAPDTPSARVSYLPTTVQMWPRDIHTPGDGFDDARIGLVSLYSLRCIRDPGIVSNRVNERVALFALHGAWTIRESTGLMSTKGNPSLSFGALGNAQRNIGLRNIWDTPSPACQYHDHDVGFGAGNNDRVWQSPYAEGPIEGSHWPGMHFAYAVSGDVRMQDQLQHQDLCLILSRGGAAGIKFGTAGSPWNDSTVDNPATGSYALALRQQPRGTGWQMRNMLWQSLFQPKYEHDYTNLRPETLYWKWRAQTEFDGMLAEANWYMANLPTQFPGVWGTFYRAGDQTNRIGTDSQGVQWWSNISYMMYHQSTTIAYAALTDDACAASARTYWNGRLERMLYFWLNETSGDNYYFTGFNNFAGWRGSSTNFGDTTTDPITLKRAINEAANGGNPVIPAGLMNNSSGGIPSIVSQALGLASQAGIGSYNTSTLLSRLQTLRGSVTPCLKYSAQP